MEPFRSPEDPHARAASSRGRRRPRWHRAVEITSAVVIGAAVAALAVGGLAIVGVWILLVVGMNNFGSNK